MKQSSACLIVSPTPVIRPVPAPTTVPTAVPVTTDVPVRVATAPPRVAPKPVHNAIHSNSNILIPPILFFVNITIT